jgi:hypothetical protein
MLTLTYYDKIKTKGVVVFNATFNNISVINDFLDKMRQSEASN